jgi:hypothetical protein
MIAKKSLNYICGTELEDQNRKHTEDVAVFFLTPLPPYVLVPTLRLLS